MAVAVKNAPDVRSSSLFDRMPVLSLLGAAYVIVCLAILGRALPYLWWEVIGFDEASMMYSILLLMVLAVAAAGLGYLGLRLLGNRAPVGTRAGIFVAFAGIVIILLLTRWASVWLEWGVYYQGWFGSNGPVVGALLTAAVAVVLLGAGIYWFLDRRFEPYLVQLDEQGWFSATSYKGQQGQRVRRGTIFGLLLIVGAGIYTLMMRGTLERGPQNWEINIPFTEKVMVTNDSKGDAGPQLADKFKEDWDAEHNQLKHPVWMSRYQLREIDNTLNGFVRITDQHDSQKLKTLDVVSKADFEADVASIGKGDTPPEAAKLTPAVGDEISNYVRIRSKGEATDPAIVPGAVVSRAEFEAEIRKLRGTAEGAAGAEEGAVTPTNKQLPTAVPVALGTGTELYQTLTLLPSVQYTLPLLLIAVTLWLAWRVVNYPVFADFLIATEAELNKVSWATRRRLFQDTIVVLITVFLMAVFLFVMDYGWYQLLSWKQIGVIQKQEDSKATQKQIDERPW